MENVKDTLRSYIMEHFNIEPDDPDFDDDVHLFDYGFVDSLGATEIVLFLEETFGVQITQKDIIPYLPCSCSLRSTTPAISLTVFMA